MSEHFKNIRLANFADTEVLVGTFMRELYCYGLVTFGPRDGLWIRLEPVADNTYRAYLANGRKIESRLVYEKES